MADYQDGILDRFAWASAEFSWRLRLVEPDHWELPTPCPAWDVRRLVNHVTRGNLNYVRLAQGGSAAEFLEMRDVDALASDPVGAYAASVRTCLDEFGQPGALQRLLDYPLGPIEGGQALAVRTTDTVIHAWDLAQVIKQGRHLDPDLVSWIDGNIDAIYAGLPETPVAAETTHRFFAEPEESDDEDASPQDRLLRLMGRKPTVDPTH
ncbi:MAG TPA: TIGR03086 family metal-binding protein [Pseudonocardia sp.]|nr:TIGR03086 family metal-binding protein [Pseudonocardia sp.]